LKGEKAQKEQKVQKGLPCSPTANRSASDWFTGVVQGRRREGERYTSLEAKKLRS